MTNDSSDPAEEAFAHLRTEVALLRRAVEGLAAAEERLEPVDYGPTLGKMAGQLAAVAKRIDALAQSPLLSLTPVQVAGDVQAAAARARQEVQGDWSRAQRGLDEAVRALGDLVPRPRATREQQRWVACAGLSGLVLGVVLWVGLSGPIARALPDQWQVAERMAAATLRLDRWEAGSRLMHGASPQDWARIVQMSALERDNREALRACRAAATKAGKAHSCRVTVVPRA